MTKQATRNDARAVYDSLSNERNQYVKRAEQAAKLTIPTLFPPENRNGSTRYETPYQSIGARGLNNLAAKLLLALMPPNASFFRLGVDDATLVELTQDPTARAQVEDALASIERSIRLRVETQQIRVTVMEAIKQLLIAGNALLFLPPKEGGVKLFRLNNYVLERDPLGNILQIVTVEKVAVKALPEETKKAINDLPEEDSATVDVYTHVYLEDGDYIAYQQVNGVNIKGHENTYPREKSPYIPLRLVKIDGDHYGRGYVEEYMGDIKTLEALTKAIVQASIAAAKIVFLVNPNGITSAKRLANAESGAFVAGSPNDVVSLQLDKLHDLQIARSTAESIEQRLSYVFMLNSAVQRGGERVTAEEIRYVAGELEDSLGGIYSLLTQELQLPLVRRLMTVMSQEGAIPDLPEGVVEPSITTGLEAIGRGHDLTKYVTFISSLGAFTEAVLAECNVPDFALRMATACGIETQGFLKTPEQKQQEQQERMQAQMMQAGIPEAAKVGGRVIEQQMEQ